MKSGVRDSNWSIILVTLTLAVPVLSARGEQGTTEPGGGFGKEPAANSASTEPDQSDLWEVKFAIDPWLAWTEGTIVVPVSLGADTVLKNLDFYAPARLGVRRGKWGVDANVLWVKLSGSRNDLPGSFLEEFNLGMKVGFFEAIVYHRLAQWNDGRSFLDVGGGARGTWLEANIGLSEDGPGIARVSAGIAEQTLDRISRGVSARINEALAGLDPQIPGNASMEATAGPVRRAEEGAAEASLEVSTGLEEALAVLDPQVPGGASRGSRPGPVRRAVERVAEARLAEAKALLAGAAARAQSKLREAREKAETELADAIDRAVREKIPSDAGGSGGWVDPIIMARLRQQLGDRLFFQLYGDVGGFGVSSDITLKTEAAVIYQVTEKLMLGLGFRWARIDYQSGNFVFDIDAYGPVVSATWTF